MIAYILYSSPVMSVLSARFTELHRLRYIDVYI
jgi:hypothetical protein